MSHAYVLLSTLGVENKFGSDPRGGSNRKPHYNVAVHDVCYFVIAFCVLAESLFASSHLYNIVSEKALVVCVHEKRKRCHTTKIKKLVVVRTTYVHAQ